MAPEPRGSQPLSAAVAAAQPGAGGEPVDTSLDARLKRVTERVAALSDALLVQVWRIVEVKAGPRSVETKDQPFSISTGAVSERAPPCQPASLVRGVGAAGAGGVNGVAVSLSLEMAARAASASPLPRPIVKPLVPSGIFAMVN